MNKSGKSIVGVILSLIGSLISICVVLYMLSYIGIDINLGDILVQGITQIKDALVAVKDAF